MTITEDGTITPETPYEVYAYGWEVYRRTQQIPWPAAAGGELVKAQSRLWHAAEAYASGREMPVADVPLIRLATADLIDVVREHCGDAAARFASGQDGTVAA